ncbi:hypothetical protein A9P82_03835 [Arachidicoccus ginsenosidimutans]|uniref:porin family protein n=1 Tax=Arachidicoccus sp. BS20 TaxID=1850526 RepID=UPI0007F0F5CB|nr:porin family protein [Arachidicoccus sp. BS20]ANI88504.1 hypothetical protein A9P82_03835 [Arachidicoccus sp. BS20]
MKKLIIGLFALATTTAFGQYRRGNSIVIQPQVGIFGGLSVANQYVHVPYDGDYSDNALAGGIAGIQLALPVSYGWYIQPEVSYSNMGTQFYQSDDAYQGNVNLHMNYLNVPVLFKYSEPFTGLGVFFGPQYSYLLSAHQNATGSQKHEYESEDVKDYYHNSDFSGVVGLEYYFPNNGMPGAKFGLSVRYQFGFVNVNNGAIDYGTTIHNNAFFLTAGIRF